MRKEKTQLAIFDFNRTLYDPGRNELMPGAREILRWLQAKGYVLVLVSRVERGRRELLDEFAIGRFFAEALFVNEKKPELFSEIAERHRASLRDAYVIGDHLHEEVRAGNRSGLRTIWLRAGAFSDSTPETEYDHPRHIIAELRDLKNIL